MPVRGGARWGEMLSVLWLVLGAPSAVGAQAPSVASGLTVPHAIEVEGVVAHTHRELEPIFVFPGAPSTGETAINGVSGGRRIGAAPRAHPGGGGGRSRPRRHRSRLALLGRRVRS